MCVYLRTKFQVSSTILTSFRQGLILPPPPSTSKQTPKSPPRLGLNNGNRILSYASVTAVDDNKRTSENSIRETRNHEITPTAMNF